MGLGGCPQFLYLFFLSCLLSLSQVCLHPWISYGRVWSQSGLQLGHHRWPLQDWLLCICFQEQPGVTWFSNQCILRVLPGGRIGAASREAWERGWTRRCLRCPTLAPWSSWKTSTWQSIIKIILLAFLGYQTRLVCHWQKKTLHHTKMHRWYIQHLPGSTGCMPKAQSDKSMPKEPNRRWPRGSQVPRLTWKSP